MKAQEIITMGMKGIYRGKDKTKEYPVLINFRRANTYMKRENQTIICMNAVESQRNYRQKAYMTYGAIALCLGLLCKHVDVMAKNDHTNEIQKVQKAAIQSCSTSTNGSANGTSSIAQATNAIITPPVIIAPSSLPRHSITITGTIDAVTLFAKSFGIKHTTPILKGYLLVANGQTNPIVQAGLYPNPEVALQYFSMYLYTGTYSLDASWTNANVVAKYYSILELQGENYDHKNVRVIDKKKPVWEICYAIQAFDCRHSMPKRYEGNGYTSDGKLLVQPEHLDKGATPLTYSDALDTDIEKRVGINSTAAMNWLILAFLEQNRRSEINARIAVAIEGSVDYFSQAEKRIKTSFALDPIQNSDSLESITANEYLNSIFMAMKQLRFSGYEAFIGDEKSQREALEYGSAFAQARIDEAMVTNKGQEKIFMLTDEPTENGVQLRLYAESEGAMKPFPFTSGTNEIRTLKLGCPMVGKEMRVGEERLTGVYVFLPTKSTAVRLFPNELKMMYLEKLLNIYFPYISQDVLDKFETKNSKLFKFLREGTEQSPESLIANEIVSITKSNRMILDEIALAGQAPILSGTIDEDAFNSNISRLEESRKLVKAAFQDFDNHNFSIRRQAIIVSPDFKKVATVFEIRFSVSEATKDKAYRKPVQIKLVRDLPALLGGWIESMINCPAHPEDLGPLVSRRSSPIMKDDYIKLAETRFQQLVPTGMTRTNP